jgi:hypothetical protein
VAGLAQTDIKSALIFSTSGQVGLMFLACGLGFWRWRWCICAVTRSFAAISSSARPRFCTNCMANAPARCRLGSLGNAGCTRRRCSGSGWKISRTGSVVRPVHRLARHLSVFDAAVVDRATGLPAPAVQALSSLAQWEERQLGAGRLAGTRARRRSRTRAGNRGV